MRWVHGTTTTKGLAAPRSASPRHATLRHATPQANARPRHATLGSFTPRRLLDASSLGSRFPSLNLSWRRNRMPLARKRKPHRSKQNPFCHNRIELNYCTCLHPPPTPHLPPAPFGKKVTVVSEKTVVTSKTQIFIQSFFIYLGYNTVH